VRFDVSDPSGQRLAHYTRKVVSSDGQFEMVLPLALNETPGRYVVAAEEIASGLRAKVVLSVTPRHD
jgi:hypothetical protein